MVKSKTSTLGKLQIAILEEIDAYDGRASVQSIQEEFGRARAIKMDKGGWIKLVDSSAVMGAYEMTPKGRRALEQARRSRAKTNPKSRAKKRGRTAAAAAGGSLAGGILGSVAGAPGAVLGSVAGGATGGHLGAAKDRKERGAIGGGVGGALLGPLGAAVGGAIAAGKPDKKNPRRLNPQQAFDMKRRLMRGGG